MELIVEKLMLEIIKSLEIKFKELMNHDEIEYHLDYSNYQYLIVISTHKGITQNELAKKMNVLKSSVSKAVKQLGDKRLIEVHKDQIDGRINRLYVTNIGNHKACRFQQVLTRINQEIFKDFSENEKAQAIKMLFRVYRNIDENNIEYANYLEMINY